ncbi:MAG: hypothetical protein BWY74_02764 [Firmicutes bacterium ADurb.Bin419]|nr:MAG: hypothetical protein BWY74_02764 [Firmicutes bacterium ADurb.Bin419]
MPIPVSLTENCSSQLIPSSLCLSTETIISPDRVNLTALFIRLFNTCCIFILSPIHKFSSSSLILAFISRFFSFALILYMFTDSSAISLTSNTLLTTSTFSASILDKSKILFRRCNKFWEQEIIVFVVSTCSSGVILIFNNRSLIPIIPFRGVRISWLIFAKNILLVLFASSAACFA